MCLLPCAGVRILCYTLDAGLNDDDDDGDDGDDFMFYALSPSMDERENVEKEFP